MAHAARVIFLFVLAMGTVEPLTAQWIHHPTPGIPRTADGKADLKAPAPRAADGRPDLSGIWGWQPGKYLGAVWQEHGPDRLQPWAFKLVKQRTEPMAQHDPANDDCVPTRVPRS
jgi:hypothetical protein